MKIVIVGAGKVGSAFARALADTRHRVRLLPARRALPEIESDVELVLLAVRDASLPELARRLAERQWVPRRAAVVHLAGALDPDVLAPLSKTTAGIGKAHPLLAFARKRRSPNFVGAALWVRGDPAARSRIARIGRELGFRVLTWDADPTRYHAAAAITANGAVALVAAAARLLESTGIPRKKAVRALAPLLLSAARNVLDLGLPEALTGPIRRGDTRTIGRHLAAMTGDLIDIKGLYLELGVQQLPLARELQDTKKAELDAVRHALEKERRSAHKLRR